MKYGVIKLEYTNEAGQLLIQYSYTGYIYRICRPAKRAMQELATELRKLPIEVWYVENLTAYEHIFSEFRQADTIQQNWENVYQMLWFGIRLRNLDCVLPRIKGSIGEKWQKIQVLEKQFGWTHRNITLGSFAYTKFKEAIGYGTFYSVYPNENDWKLEDKLFSSIHGGFVYTNPAQFEYANTSAIDVNSLYPSVMMKYKLPYGEPIARKGYYENNSEDYYYFYRLRFGSIWLKRGGLPYLKVWQKPLIEHHFFNTVLAEKDFKRLEENYEWLKMEVLETIIFKAKRIPNIENYVEPLMQIKGKGDFEKGIAKFMMNVITGKFGQTRFVKNERFEITSRDGKHRYPALYSAILDCGRQELFNVIDFIGRDNLLYCDTDSIKFKDYRKPGRGGRILSRLINAGYVNETELGKWKIEFSDTPLKIFGQKQYAYLLPCGKPKIVCSGARINDENTPSWVNITTNTFINNAKIEYKKELLGYKLEWKGFNLNGNSR